MPPTSTSVPLCSSAWKPRGAGSPAAAWKARVPKGFSTVTVRVGNGTGACGTVPVSGIAPRTAPVMRSVPHFVACHAALV